MPDDSADGQLAKAMVARKASNSAFKSRGQIKDAISGIDEARRPYVEKRLLEMPRNYRKTYISAMRGRSRKAALAAFCAECMCWSRRDVRRCSALGCPLHLYRPYQRTLKGKKDAIPPL